LACLLTYLLTYVRSNCDRAPNVEGDTTTEGRPDGNTPRAHAPIAATCTPSTPPRLPCERRRYLAVQSTDPTARSAGLVPPASHADPHACISPAVHPLPRADAGTLRSATAWRLASICASSPWTFAFTSRQRVDRFPIGCRRPLHQTIASYITSAHAHAAAAAAATDSGHAGGVVPLMLELAGAGAGG
jgi:hypothetical protein